MSPVKTKLESREAQGRARNNSGQASLRKSRLRTLALENLEARTLMATLPALLVTKSPTVVDGFNTSDGKVNDNNPTITINPNNASQLVATFGVRNANIQSPNSFFTVGAKFSSNGGQSWTTVGLPTGNQILIDEPGATPSTANPPLRYQENDDAVGAWDANNNFYILTTQRNSDNGAGVVFLSKYTVAGNAPSGATTNLVYFWNQTNLPQNTVAFNFPGVRDATLAVDTNPSTITDPSTGATQTDAFTNRIHIAWVKDTPPPPTPPNPWNRYTIEVLQSTNGGTSFSTPIRVSGGNFGGDPIQQYSSPKITISQNRLVQPGLPAITGGQVTVVFDDFGSGSNQSPPVDIIQVARLVPTAGGGYANLGTATVGRTTVRGAVTPGNYPVTTLATSKGIGPGAVIASDNTLGSFSQFQGRLYVAYVDILDNVRFGVIGSNQADNTDIFVKFSDNGGASWSFENVNTALGGVPIPSNDDDAVIDGYTGAGTLAGLANGTAFALSGRPQFQPQLAVDQSTGTLVLSYLDARDDASRARVVTTIGASIDGGQTFSSSVYTNFSQTAVDAITGNPLQIGPIPENQSGGDPNSDGDRGYGNYQGLAVANGVAYPLWVGNANGLANGKGQLSVLTNAIHFAAGPRIIASTMGPVKAQNDSGQLYNNTFASDGTQQFTGFGLTFDRSIDPNTFPTSAVTVTFQPANGSMAQNIPVGSIVPTNNNPASGPIDWLVRLQSPQSGVGTYTYAIQPVIKDRLRSPATVAVVPNNNPQTTSLTGLNLRVPPVGTGGSGIAAQDTTVSVMPVNVFPAGSVIASVIVSINLTHTFDFDLTISLTSPNGSNVVLSQNHGGSGQNYTNTIFSDAALIPISFGTAPFTGTFLPDQPLSGLNAGTANGNWTLQINDGFSLDSGFLQDWSLTIDTGTLQLVPGKTGNLMDQNADGTPGSAADAYLNPKPLSGNTISAPFDNTTVPIIVSGPHAIDTSVVNTSASFDNLVQNQGVSSLDVTFDRNMNTATFDNTDVLRIQGPLGVINGPTIFQAGPAYKATNLGATIPDNTGALLDSTLTIPSSAGTFKIDNLAITLSIAHPNVSNLIVTLIAPDGTQIPLISKAAGAGANLTNTTFDDTAGLTFAQGVAPFTNVYRPISPLATLKGKVIDGKWTLRIQDVVSGSVGSLTNWSLVITPQITVTPVPVYDFRSPNVLLTAGSPSALLITPPVGSGGSGGTFTLAALKLKATLLGADNSSLTLIGPDGTTYTIPNLASDADVVVSIPTAVGKSLSGVWTLTASSQISAWSLTATVDTSSAADFGTPNVYQTFRVTFPQQLLNGTYSVILGPNIQAVAGANGGDLIDNNQNAGLDLLRGNPAPGGAQVVKTYNSTAIPITTQTAKLVSGQPVPGTISSTLVISDDYVLQGATLSLNISFPNDPDLAAFLTAPDGTIVKLFTKVGNVGPTPRKNFQNTVFSDSAATLIQNGAPPFIGQFVPQTPLANLIGKNAKGTWTLTIQNFSTSLVGTLSAWSLGLSKAQSNSGLGETVADQTVASFRLFTLDPTNSTSTTTWTAVGPAGIGGAAGPSAVSGESNGAGVRSSRIGGMVLDPSDPSGNTAFLAGASGGVWKTSNFLTENPNGPTWIPLTDYGPTFSLNIGSLTAFGRNNDPKQTIVFAATGEGDTGSQGVGFLRSLDGGGTWTVLDSTTNVDAAGIPLAITSPLRDHIFLGSTSFTIVVDPRPTPSGETIVYATLSGNANQAGIWRSQDTGKTWTRVLVGQATDVTLDPNSGTIDAVSNPTGNLRILYAALRGQGVYISPNGGGSWNLMAGGVGDPLTRDIDRSNNPPVPVDNPPRTPNGAKGRIVLAKPALTGNATQDIGYQGWLYAAVATPDSHFDGLYVTKDFGQNWTAIRLPTLTNPATPQSIPIVPTNDPASPDYDPTGGFNFGQANYDISLVADPNHPEVVYVGGSRDGAPSGLIRVDITYLQDAHSFFLAQNNADGGQRLSYAQGSVILKTPANPKSDFPPSFYSPLSDPIQNFLRDPSNPFQSGATSFVTDTLKFTNTGQGARFIPWDNAVEGNTDQHEVFAFKDPLTGLSRFVFGADQGVFTAVDRGDGTFVHSLGKSSTAAAPNGFVVNQSLTSSDLSGTTGTVNVVSGGRNGNLQINQIYYGASQPSVNAGLAAQLSALFYFTLQDNGFPQSDPNILTSGNLRYTGPGGDGGGQATDQTGSGTSFNYRWPCCGGNTTDFFQVDATGRTFGLIQQSGQGSVPDPQWPFAAVLNFAVNPISPGGNQIVISSATGNIFRTENQGIFWNLIADRTILDGTQSNAQAFGAPDPSAPGYNGQTDSFIYVGTSGGRIYLTRTGGGSVAGSNAWADISAGLDGSQVMKIVTNPTRGSGEAYAVTSTGVFHMVDSRVAGATWVKITGNLFAITHNSFGNVNLTETLGRALSTIQADYRYFIPDNLLVTNGPAHPVLYVGGDAGVYRSFDNGVTWTLFPDIATNGSLAEGGYFPNAQVTDLNLALGNINPTTGRPFDNTTGVFDSKSNPNILLASTYGRGAYAIRLAPIVFQNSVKLDPALPAPGGSQGTIGSNGLPKISFPTPFIQGFTAQTAFGYKVTVNLVDLTGVDLNDPAAIAAAAVTQIIGTGVSDAYGKFSIQIKAGSFTSNGVKVIGIQSIDGSGTKGNVATLSFTLASANLGLPVPPVTPTLLLLASDNTGPAGQNITRIKNPRLTGKTDPNVTVEILDNTPLQNIVNSGLSDSFGNYTIRVPQTGFLGDGTYTYLARARNANGTSSLPNPSITITIKTTAPPAPTLNINPADDTGIQGDGITTSRRPRLTGTASLGGTVNLYQVISGTPSNVPLATTIADAVTGVYTVTLPNDLTNGSITLEARGFDNVGNPSPFSPSFALTIVTVTGDYNNDVAGAAEIAVYRPFNTSAPSYTNWFITSAPGNTPYSSTTTFGATDPGRDVPIQGDFEGKGKTNLALFRPSTAQWFIQRPSLGNLVIQFGQPGVDIPITGDYDGDGVTDLAVWRPTTATFYIAYSSGGGVVKQYGWAGHDIPVTADYDGTGKAQIAVFRPETSQWFIDGSTGNHAPITFGATGDIPVPADYAGQHRAALAVYRPSTGQFIIQPTAPGSPSYTVTMNAGTIDGTETPVPLDYDGDGHVDPTIYRGSTATWYSQRSTRGPLVYQFGWGGVDIAIPGSYNYKLTANLKGPKGSKLGGAFSLSGGAITTSISPQLVTPTQTIDVTSTTTTSNRAGLNGVGTTTTAVIPAPAPTQTTTIRRRISLVAQGHTAQTPGGPRKFHHTAPKGHSFAKSSPRRTNA